MFKKFLTAATLAVACNANASIMIDFTGIAAGAQVLDYYNGGTDSTGASGTNYGVRFEGGVIEYDEYGPRLRGASTMTFNPSIVPVAENGIFNIGFLATFYGLDGEYSYIQGDESYDSAYVTGTENPFCYHKTPQQCYDSGWLYVYPSYLGGYYFTSFGSANKISFNVDALDNIEFGVSGRPDFRPAFVAAAEVPEPASLALFGIAGAALIARRRKKSV